MHNLHKLFEKSIGILQIPCVYYNLNHKRPMHIYGALFGYSNL
jgi:hypothetical protein